MLLKHIENVRGKSENYRMLYAFSASILFTGVVASFWVFTWFIPGMGGVANSASVASAVDGGGSSDISPTGVVKQEAGSVFNSFFDSMKGLTNKPFMGGQYEVKYSDGTLGLSQNNTAGNSVTADAPLTPDVFSTTTQDGITVEADNSAANISTGDSNADVSTSTINSNDGAAGNVSGN